MPRTRAPEEPNPFFTERPPEPVKTIAPPADYQIPERLKVAKPQARGKLGHKVDTTGWNRNPDDAVAGNRPIFDKAQKDSGSRNR